MAPDVELHAMTAAEMADSVREGRCSSEQIVRSCLDRIAVREPVVGAWEFLDPEQALAEARARDAEPAGGLLHGVPVAVKDVFDTADMPTGYGSPIYRGHRPVWDAACVASLRRAGAVILGKSVTTEFAAYRPGKTANPHDPAHTPGGSSSGSAAAVADRMVPLALGTQTAGSVIRPASFCGVVGYKPTFGWISRAGLKPLAESLDTVGVFAGTVADASRIVAVMAHRPSLASPGPTDRTPRIGICRTHEWPRAEEASMRALEEAAERLRKAGASTHEAELPDRCRGLFAAQEGVMAFEAARSLAYESHAHEEEISEQLERLIQTGRDLAPEKYDADLRLAREARAGLPDVFGGADALLVPSVPGEAPAGLGSTGDPAFNRVWTLLHVPCVNLPAGRGPAGLPVGVQLVGRHGEDAKLLAVARWAEAVLSPP